MIVCISESRASCEVGVKLLILSLAEHCPEIPVELTFPPADDAFKAWLRPYTQVQLRTEALPDTEGWNVKPQTLLPLLRAGHNRVVWLDSDIVVTKAFRREFEEAPNDTLIVAEEAPGGSPDDGEGMRAQMWGLPVGRALPHTINSCVIGATAAHIAVLERWQQLLSEPEYRNWQKANYLTRPRHMLGDQDVWTAVLASSAYSHVPLKILRQGRDIIQYFRFAGYSCGHRLRNLLFGMPAFVHAQGVKPWELGHLQEQGDFETRVMTVYLDVSPYKTAARKYRDRLGQDAAWINTQTRPGTLMRALGFNHPALVGFPLALVLQAMRGVKLALGRR